MPTLQQARHWYLDADQVHDFDHIQRVYRLAEHIARLENADLEVVRAAVLLHDAQSASGNESQRSDHHLAATEFAAEVLKKEGWSTERIAAVQECIRTHRFRANLAPQTLEAKVLFDADKLDAIGAIGVARAVAYAVLDGQPIYADPSPAFLATLKTEPGEAYTAYNEFLFKLSQIKDRMQTGTGKALAEARHNYMAAFFEQLIAEVHGER